MAGDLIIPFQGLTFLVLFIIYSLIIVVFIMHQKVKIIPLLEALNDSSGIDNFKSRVSQLKNIFFLSLNDFEISSKVIVFSSLLALVVFYSYYLNDGAIVVDQWFHHGRALLIDSGNFKMWLYHTPIPYGILHFFHHYCPGFLIYQIFPQ